MMMDPKKEESNMEIKWNPFKVLSGLRREAPEFTRCCFCISLRKGLIGWGYTKVVLDIAVLVMMGFLLKYLRAYALFFMDVAYLLIDAGFNTFLIVGCHQRNIKFLKIIYIYGLVSLGLLVLNFAYTDIILIIPMTSENPPYAFQFILELTLPGMSAQFLALVMHIYWTVLIHSVMVKLQNESLQIQFTNTPAEAQCTVQSLSTANHCTGQRDHC